MGAHDELMARVVERAQRDPDYRARLLADPDAAVVEELGELPEGVTLRIVQAQPEETVLVLPRSDADGGPAPS